ncbi:Probable RNA helicase armi [Gryllus bimaculatus]|nr:Probable RNA helicase armi [Gryllus bimaculatus]
MFPILKSLVNYVIGQKTFVSDVGEAKASITTIDESPIDINQTDKSASDEFDNDALSIAELEKEIRVIEGWEEETWKNDLECKVDEKNTITKTEANNTTQSQFVNHGKNLSDLKSEIIHLEKNDLPSDLQLCQYRIGTVTNISDDYAIIDHELSFMYKHVQNKKIQKGDRINYIVFRRHVDEEWQLHKVLETADESWEEKCKETKTEIVKSSGAINRKMIGQVESKDGREVYVKPNIKFLLDDVRCDFIPYEGDWLSINAFVELDGNVQDFVGEILAIYDVQPLRSRIVSGLVTAWDENKKEGIIDGSIWFAQSECEPEYVPAVEDSVVVQAIESTHGTCTWRGLSIASLEEKESKNGVNKTTKDVPSCIKNGISVPRRIDVGCVSYGQSKECTIEMSNLGKDHHLLLRGRFHGKRSESQITLLSKIDDGTIIGPGQNISCRFRVNGKFIGHSCEIFVFTFKGFKMTCNINIEVQDLNLTDLIDRKQVGRRGWMDTYARTRNGFNSRSGIIMKGIQPVKPPAFVPVRFGIFTVPEYMWKAVLAEDNKDCTIAKIVSRLGEVVPCLKRDLSANNYNSRLHSLLYLEEIELSIRLHEYDMEKTTLSFVGEYLSLEVPGLAEKRPSVLVGDKVDVESSNQQGHVYEGFVHKVCANALLLKFHSHFHQTYESEECNVRFVLNRGPLRKCHVAVDLALKHLGEYVLFPNCIKLRDPQISLEENEEGSADILYNNHNRYRASRKIPLMIAKPPVENGAPVYQETGKQYLTTLPAPRLPKKAVKLRWFNSNLNYCQKEAVRNVLKGEARPLPYVIFGPPGTGKTMTLIETILQIYILIPDSRILVATPSNSSANLIAERLLISQLLSPGDLVRLVAYHCLEEGTVPEILLPYSTACDLNSTKVGETHPVTYKLKKSSNASVLGRHRITVGTCIALGQLYSMGFPRGFLHKDWGQAILAGDPLQLGPVVNSRVCSEFGLGYSYLARILNSHPYQRDTSAFSQFYGYNPKLVTKLVMNYRSLPEILNLPSTLFYDSQLIPQLAKCLPKRDSALPPSVIFHGVRGVNFQDSDCPSWFNPQELVQIIYYLKDFLDAGLTPDDIGVITPYQKQVQKLRSLLNQLELPSPKVGSVEEFQGQERLVILLSTVRSSTKHVDSDIRHSLGFVASPQRLNVALTRARALLIIIGNPHLLSRDAYWKKTLAYCIDQKAYVGCDVPKEFMDFSCVSK